jgi:AraC-like DNA-binding protein
MLKQAPALIFARPVVISGEGQLSCAVADPSGHVPAIELPSHVNRRRRVDWPLIVGRPGTAVPAPKLIERPIHAQLAALLSAFGDILALENRDAILRRAVEVARDKIGLCRAAIFLFDRSRKLMLGTWGSDLSGALVDERHIMYSLSDTDREAFRRATEEGVRFTIFDGCPIVEHHGPDTRVVGRGWVAWTPIVSAHATVGMLFNDAGLSGAPVDETKQAHAAILCALLATILDPVRGVPGAGSAGPGQSRRQRLVTTAAAMLAEDPTLAGQAIARRCGVTLAWFVRVFKADMGMSLVEYRNRLRLDRVDALLRDTPMPLNEAALAAGFGSYAQFHRVFRKLRDAAPRDYLRHRP